MPVHVIPYVPSRSGSVATLAAEDERAAIDKLINVPLQAFGRIRIIQIEIKIEGKVVSAAIEIGFFSHDIVPPQRVGIGCLAADPELSGNALA